MDEPQARVLFARLSGTEAPPSRVDISLARRSGHRKLIRRRAARSGTPAVAVAVLALFAGGVLPAGWHGQYRGSHPPAAPQPADVRTFNPLVPFAGFGWLPAGDSLISGNTARVSQYLDAGPGPLADWSVTVTSAGRCNLSSGQILRRLRHGAHPELQCVLGPGDKGVFALTRQAPAVSGHIAFRGDGQILAWEYARNSWAVLRGPAREPDLKVMVKVAAGLTFGHLRQHALKFPIQLTGLPGAWRVGSVRFVPDAGVKRGQDLYLVGAGGADGPMVTVAPARPGSPCRIIYPHGQRRTINGVKVVVNHIAADHSSPASFQVCADHANGLFLLIVTGQEQPRAVSIFRHNLRLLGRDPASWTTSPLG
jgi:hypothetical protein